MALPDPGHIFFYGTLMSGFGLRRRAAIEPFVRFVGPGAVRAALFDLGPYPAAIRAEGTVRGELYAVTCADRLIPRVDAIEGCVPGDVLRSQYVREAVEVRLDRGLRQCAWMYFYALSLGAAAWIPAGDYRAHLARRSTAVVPGPARACAVPYGMHRRSNAARPFATGSWRGLV